MFGAMPSDFMLFEVSEKPDVEEDEVHSVTTSDANDSKWDVNHRSVDDKANSVHDGCYPRTYLLNIPQRIVSVHLPYPDPLSGVTECEI